MKPSKSYKWKRFWCPREGRIRLLDNGYLYDPDSEYGKSFNPDVVSFESIFNIPCLIMIGEPRISKSFTMEMELEKIRTNIDKEGDNIIWKDLREYGSEDRLNKEIFEDEKFLSWVDNTNKLYLFLDSLDECLLKIDNIGPLLINKFN